jgi:hypothetical protein
MKARLFFLPIASMMVALILFMAVAAKGDDPPPEPQVIEVDVTVQGKTAAEWHTVAARYRRQMFKRWQPTVDYAYRLASAVFGVPYWELHAVGSCESHHYPFARNGRYLGVMQLGWRPFGFSPFDPVANVLSAAATVSHDGSWRQWSCKP